jgi:cbb3-type cytochrome oxidase maturation protein
MSVLYILIPVSIALAAGFVLVCLAAIRGGQFDDLESPRWRVLFDEKVQGRKQK